MKKKEFFLFSLCAVVVLFLSGCNKGDDDSFSNIYGNLVEYERINKFIIDGVQTFYLWEAETDWKQYDRREVYAQYKDHDELFYQLRSKEDKWSYLTDDIKGLENEFAGISTTFGYSLSFYRLSSVSNEVIAVVLFTSPDSPAENAGIKRGDIIVEMNGGKITTSNYANLYYSASLQLQCGVWDMDTKTIETLPEVKNLTAVTMYEDPINTYNVIEKSGHKIGYLCYTAYQEKSERELIRIFSEFKAAGVKDVVLDLRYNPGGYARTSLLLGSILAPENYVKNKSVFLEHHYNALYTAYLTQNKYPLNDFFLDTLSVNMNLNRLYVLTGKNTASASEATIVGLEPYLKLVQIGDTTSGKYCGGVLLSPENFYDEKNYYSNFVNWGMYIMIYRFANIKGISSFTGGLAPNILEIEDEFDLKPFGDENDPLLRWALADISGEQYIEKRSKPLPLPFIALPDLKRPVDGRMIDRINNE